MPGFRFNLQAIGFGIVICDFEMRHQWNTPSKLVDLLDYRLNSRKLGYTRGVYGGAPCALPGWHDECHHIKCPALPRRAIHAGWWACEFRFKCGSLILEA